MKMGSLVPDDLVLSMIISEIKQTESKKLLLDGFPRTRAQAEVLCEHGIQLNYVLNIVVPHDIIIERLKHRRIHLSSGRAYNKDFNIPKNPGKDDVTGEPLVQREDDRPDVVAKRLKDYDESVSGLLTFYGDKKILNNFCGNETNVIWPMVDTFLSKMW